MKDHLKQLRLQRQKLDEGENARKSKLTETTSLQTFTMTCGNI
ncbi:11484_t:CDS:2 [Paraglomus brasilianum]|uniref:11484_t:CDS:1 n=1 Tax=Paraglomus brasilianum TaxID=144538 RepID=A0A9N9C8Q4_9GLOM|nr:11484_t:CDS:2 [Paraglomus brasilianum]